MIGFLKGKVEEVSAETFYVDVGGVGYEVYASADTLSFAQGLLGENVFVSIYTHVREDIIQLFGFRSSNEKNFFLSLLKVNGIGPKMAIQILSGAPFEQVQQMIETSDVKRLTALPKVGKKTAEQMVLTLKGKLVMLESENKKVEKPKLVHPEISTALIHLGFKPLDVSKVVSELPEKIEVQEGVRRGLAALSQI